MDVVLNFGSSSLSEDNLVAQWSLAGRNVTFFGDDTWIKLFPEQFIRWDGTHSFFVADYTEVTVTSCSWCGTPHAVYLCETMKCAYYLM